MNQEQLNIASSARREKLQPIAKAALDLAIWAAEGRSDYFIAAQLSMLVRKFSQVMEPSETYPDAPAVMDWLGMQVQAVTGKAHSLETLPQPPTKAVGPVHETVLEAAAGGNGNQR